MLLCLIRTTPIGSKSLIRQTSSPSENQKCMCLFVIMECRWIALSHLPIEACTSLTSCHALIMANPGSSALLQLSRTLVITEFGDR